MKDIEEKVKTDGTIIHKIKNYIIVPRQLVP